MNEHRNALDCTSSSLAKTITAAGSRVVEEINLHHRQLLVLPCEQHISDHRAEGEEICIAHLKELNSMCGFPEKKL